MIASSFYHYLVLYLLVDVWQLGIYGCSWGTVITYMINIIIITLYCRSRKDLRSSFFFPTRECFSDLWEYFRMGLPSCAMLSLEWWSFEIQAVLASYISTVAVGSMVIMMNTLTVITMIPFGA